MGSATLCGVAALSLVVGPAAAQEKQAPAPAGVRTGPATVAPHWSRYKYPESIPEGAAYHIVERGDTLWDLAQRYLGNPFLWPQIWDQNRYVTDAHWIYPGDPLLLPKVTLISDRAGQPGAEGLPGEEGGLPGELPPGGEPGAALVPVTEEVSLQCAPYMVTSREDDSLRIIGSEHGATKIAFADRDILYLNKGSNSGVKAGELYTLQHLSYPVKHPVSGRTIGTKVETTGWVRVILVQENTATAIVEQACGDVHAGDYLKPYERVNVPLILSRAPADRLTPPSGKLDRFVVDIADDAMIAGAGHMVMIDAGSESGIAPGNIFTIYRVMYPTVPTPRNVLGELAVVAVRENTSTAKVIYSNDAIMVGDQIELR